MECYSIDIKTLAWSDPRPTRPVIGLYRDGAEMRIFDFESWPVDLPNSEFKYFKAAGSGYGTLLDIAPNLRMKITSGKPNKLEKGIATSLQIVGNVQKCSHGE